MEDGWLTAPSRLLPPGISFDILRLPSFVFSHTAAQLVLQGMTLQDFFPPDSYFTRGDQKIEGPFILLKGTLSDPWDPPLRLRDFALAVIRALPEDIKRDDLLSLLLSYS